MSSLSQEDADWMNAPMGPYAPRVTTIRASALPLAFRCAQSVVPPEISIRETSEPARLGTAVHEALRPLAEGGQIAWDDLPKLAARHEVDLEDVQMLCRMGAKLWPEIADSFPNAATEVELSAELPGAEADGKAPILTGHIDALSFTGTVARAIDWKTGRLDSDYSEQMRGYGYLVLKNNPNLDELTVTVVWLRDASIETYTMVRGDAAPWGLKLFSSVLQAPPNEYRPGAHCDHCNRSHECPARRAMVRRDVSAFLDMAPTETVITATDMVRMVRTAKMVAKIADNVQAYAKRYVEEHGDVVGDGTRLILEEVNRRELDVAKAWPVLEQAGFKDDDFVEVVKLAISKVESRIAKKAGKGAGAGAVRALQSKLDEAGAVSVKTTHNLVEKRT